MKKSHRAIIIAGISSVLVAQIVFVALLERPNGVRISFPYENATVPRGIFVTGDAWMKDGIDSIDVILTRIADGTSTTVPAERAVVTDRGEPVFALATYRAELAAPADGEYELSTRIRGGDLVMETKPRRLVVSGPGITEELGFFSLAHLIPLLLVVIVSIALPVAVRRTGSERAKTTGALVITAMFYIDEIIYQIYWFRIGAWPITDALMIHMCGIAVLLTPIMFFTRSERLRQGMFDILYFWGLGGAVQALLTPYVGLHTFPAIKYFAYFISHGTIVVSVIYIVVVYRMDLSLKSLLRAFAATAIGAIVAYGINMLMRLIPPYEPANYWVMGYPPPTGSVVDLFAEWFGPTPRYTIGLAGMAIVLFTLLWLPFPIRRAVRARRSGDFQAAARSDDQPSG
jgi:hypothetical integral membrane protein (TIGR02206 family)